MMRVFICPACGKVRVVSKFLKSECYDCGAPMKACRIPYVEWVDLKEEDRERIRRSYMA